MMGVRNFWACLMIGVLLSVGALAGVSQGDPIKVGCVFAITGNAAFLGEPEANTARMVADMVNAQGGIDGRKIELIIEDTQGDETRTVNAVKSLIRQDVMAIIGPSRSGCTMAVIEICNSQQVPLISCAAAETITNPVRKWVFKTPQKDSHVVEKIYDYMKAHGMKKVALITGTTGFGAAGRTQLKEKAEIYGIQVVADETYGPADTDMTAQLTKIKAAGPDAIVNWSIVPAQSIVMKNMKQLGIDIQLFQSHGFGNVKYVQAAGDAAEGVLCPASCLLAVDQLPHGHPYRAALAEYKNLYESKFGGDVSTFGGHAYDALWLVIEACQTGDISRAGIRDYIENRKNFLGTAGMFNFSPEDHTGLTKEGSLSMLTIKNGKFTLVQE